MLSDIVTLKNLLTGFSGLVADNAMLVVHLKKQRERMLKGLANPTTHEDNKDLLRSMLVGNTAARERIEDRQEELAARTVMVSAELVQAYATAK